MKNLSKKLMKKNEGITLIALIITIIILIILTAVTINNVIGTDLIGFATKAVENYTDAARDEADKVDKLVGTLDNQGVGEDSKVRAGEIVAKTEKNNYTDAEGRKATIPQGFKVSTKSSEQYIKDGLVIQDADGNEFVWVPCYYGDTKPTNAPIDLQEYKKHDYEVDNTWKMWHYAEYYWKEEGTENGNSYGNASVAKYGGFYIGRYEAGFPDYDTSTFTKDTQEYIISLESEREKKNKQAVEDGRKPVSKANVFAWNFISHKNAKTLSERMYGSDATTEGYVNSYLVDGTAWDTVLHWIATDGIDVTDCTQYGNVLDNGSDYTGWYAEHIYYTQINDVQGSTGWLYANKFKKGQIQLKSKDVTEDEWSTKKEDVIANEKTNITDYNLSTRIQIPTGSYANFKLKNIYDLAGNMSEWTAEVGDHKTSSEDATFQGLFAVCRGSHLNLPGFWDTINIRNGVNSSNDFSDIALGFRVVLYIK